MRPSKPTDEGDPKQTKMAIEQRAPSSQESLGKDQAGQ